MVISGSFSVLPVSASVKKNMTTVKARFCSIEPLFTASSLSAPRDGE